MKQLQVLLFSIFFSISAFCQQSDITKPVYLRFPTIPDFSIFKAPDSTVYTRSKIKKNKQVMFFIFSPECSHCKKETEMILKNIHKLQNLEIIMVTYLPYEEMMGFYKTYNLGRYNNIVVGRDAKFFFPTYYNVKFFPSMYIYDKKGNFKKFLEGDVKFDTLFEALK